MPHSRQRFTSYAHDHIKLQLAHAPRNAVSATYNHALYLEPRVKMMQDWADYLERTMREVKVIPMPDSATKVKYMNMYNWHDPLPVSLSLSSLDGNP